MRDEYRAMILPRPQLFLLSNGIQRDWALHAG
jgi:hypothetical protein